MAFKDLVGKNATKPEPDRTTTSPPARPAAPRAPAPDERRSAPIALLDASVEFNGTIRCRESIRIDATGEGALHCEHAVIIGQPAVLRMAIEADTVVVAGQVDGNITARSKITLEPTARVTGNLRTPGIVIQEGARLEGRIMIDSELESATTQPPRQNASSAEASAEPQPPTPGKPTPNAPAPAS